ncbi:hypothetical protein [Verminephrobacter eiseniae]|uniref:hypothetical protein n=1 Tax=Verminephrobacter eiseniae TaxID=364317 RepID=UPI0022388C64|nr:hypothetical protein [Verminephrobacter eiseniae]
MAAKKEQLAQEVAKTVGAGKAMAMETVDFNDPNRPKTCLEVDFPILPVNQVAIIEDNAGKPIYRAVSIYTAWHASQAHRPVQGSLFDGDGEYEA